MIDSREFDSQHNQRHISHPLQFAIWTIVIILFLTLDISFLIHFHRKNTFFSSRSVIELTTGKLNKAPWRHYNIRPNDNLEKIFKHYKIQYRSLHELMQLKKSQKILRNLIPGHTLYFIKDQQNKLQKLVYNINQYQFLEVVRIKNQLHAKMIQQKFSKDIERASIQINHSLSEAANQAGFSSMFISRLSKIFDNKINFKKQIQPGDQFQMIYEEYYANNKPTKTGHILAAEYTHHHQHYYAIRYKVHGKVSYFTPQGTNLRRRFLRAPVKYTRISSPFNERRMHPILHIIRPHEGVDLAAPMGRPIHATGDGTIIYRGRKGGYGNVIILQNGPKYSTLFAHMSRFARQFHLGSHVKLGQIIGYVGKTGLATGPHVHFEFRINGVHYDPMKVHLPNARPIPKVAIKKFKQYAHQMETVLNGQA